MDDRENISHTQHAPSSQEGEGSENGFVEGSESLELSSGGISSISCKKEENDDDDETQTETLLASSALGDASGPDSGLVVPMAPVATGSMAVEGISANASANSSIGIGSIDSIPKQPTRHVTFSETLTMTRDYQVDSDPTTPTDSGVVSDDSGGLNKANKTDNPDKPSAL